MPPLDFSYKRSILLYLRPARVLLALLRVSFRVPYGVLFRVLSCSKAVNSEFGYRVQGKECD